jgi:cyanate permease
LTVGWLKDATGSFEAGLYVLSAFALMSAIVALVAVPEPRRETVAAAAGIGIPAA